MSYSHTPSLLALASAGRPTGANAFPSHPPNEDQHDNDAPTLILPSLRDMLHTPVADPLLPTQPQGRWEEPRFTPPIGISSHTDFIHRLDQRDQQHSSCRSCSSVPEGRRGLEVEGRDNPTTPRLLRQVSAKLHVLRDSYYSPRQRHVILRHEKMDAMDIDSSGRNEYDGGGVNVVVKGPAVLEHEAKLQKVGEMTSDAASPKRSHSSNDARPRPRQDYNHNHTSSPTSSSQLSDGCCGSSSPPTAIFPSENTQWESTQHKHEHKHKHHRRNPSSLASASSHEPSTPRRVARLACLPCRHRKVKCDANFPVCGTCEARDSSEVCEWKKSARGGARVSRK